MKNLVSEEEGKKARNLYLKGWRKRNPDKINAISIRYWAKRALKENSQNNGSDNK